MNNIKIATNTPKKMLFLFYQSKYVNKPKKVGDILKNLGLNIIGSGKNDLSITHNNILYK